MAKRYLRAQIKSCDCTYCESDRLVTKEGLSLTPARIKEMTDRGISVSLPNSQNFVNPTDATSSWFVEPMFKRDATMVSMWEQEQLSKQKILRAQKNDKLIYGK